MNRWLNFWRLRRASDGPVTVEFYVRRDGVRVITRVIGHV